MDTRMDGSCGGDTAPRLSSYRWAFAALTALNGVANAQQASLGRESVDISDASMCSRCTIRVEHLVTLTVGGSTTALSAPKVVREDSHGRFWLITGFDPPRLFDATGRFVRELGRKGTGPGEFETPQDVMFLPGDSVMVIETGVAQIFDASLHHGRRIAMGRQLYPGVIVKWPEAVVMAGDVGGPYLGKRRVHLISFTGTEARVTESLPEDEVSPRSPVPSAGTQILARSTLSGGVWYADPLAYRLMHWTSAGRPIQVFTRNPPWFSGRSEFWLGNPQTPPPPVLAGLSEDSDGNLWVYAHVAADTWPEAWRGVSNRARDVRVDQVDVTLLYRTRVDVVDIRKGRLVASQEIKPLIVGALRDRRVVLYEEDAEGLPRVTIARLHVERN